MNQTRKGILIALVEDAFFEAKLQELINLCQTINIEISHVITQALKERKSGLIGKGKIAEILDRQLEFDVIITYQPLSPLDIRVLSDAFDCEVYDKTRVILQIFAIRAQSKLSKLEVALANAVIKRDELVGSYSQYSRQAGSSGAMSARGGGEQQLQIDRRVINRAISKFKREIKKEYQKQLITKKKQKEQGIFTVALVGYTNAGKSTLMNQLLQLSQTNKSHKQVLSQDQVFSSLDTTTRHISIDTYPTFLCVDTVGFIIDLPTECVASFNSTLTSISEVDCVCIVLDGTYSLSMQLETIEPYLNEIDSHQRVTVVNKKDEMVDNHTPYLAISAKHNIGIEQLLNKIKQIKISQYIYKEGYCQDYHVFEFYKHVDYIYIQSINEKNGTTYIKVYCDPKVQYLFEYIKSTIDELQMIS